MLTIAEFELPPGEFPLGRVFETLPDVTLELDRVVPVRDTVMPYFWVHDPEGRFEDVLAVFDDLPQLRSIALLEDLGDRALFSAEWDPVFVGIMNAIATAGVTVVSARGSPEGWTFELRAADSGQLSEFQRLCREREIPVTLAHLERFAAPGDRGAGLTPEQREAVTVAYESGYYDDPRETDLESMADRLGISRQALAARLRRAYRTLVERVVLDDEQSLE